MLLYHILSYFSIFYHIKWYPYIEEGDCVKPLKNKVSITLDEDIIKQIKELAEDDDRSFSQYINMVLKEWISKIDNEQI